MKKIASLLFALPLTVLAAISQNTGWSVAPSPWPESFGSQRAVIEVTGPGQVAGFDLDWRRHDPRPENHRFLIIEAATGDTVPSIRRLEVNREHCRLQFGPVVRTGTYYFYYLPFPVVDGWGYFGKDYLTPETAPAAGWPEENATTAIVRIDGIQCRTQFDSFYPMEIIPTAREKADFFRKYPEPVLWFAEDRRNPIRMKDEIPAKWMSSGPGKPFAGTAQPNEYYTFQIGILAAGVDLGDLTAVMDTLRTNGHGGSPGIPLTCFNTEGIDPYGKKFSRLLSVQRGTVQTLWFGADIPRSAPPGTYSGRILIHADPSVQLSIPVTITVAGPVIEDRGDGETWRYSRLRWLNSTAGSDGDPVPPYEAITSKSPGRFTVAEHQIDLLPDGLPKQITPEGVDLLAAPLEWTVTIEGKIVDFPVVPGTSNLMPGKYEQTATGFANRLRVDWHLVMEYDGYLKTTAILRNPSTRDSVRLDDIALSIPLRSEKARYMMGMGLPGCAVPATHDSKWKGPSDSFWIGDADAGVWCELRGSSYTGPLLNLYHPAPPESWNNGGKGGFSIRSGPGRVTATAYSGTRVLLPGDSLTFEWALLVTPVKRLNTAGQFTDRYYHRGDQPVPTPEDFKAGVTIVNIHHANIFNPFINYPFLAVDRLKAFTDSIHSLGKKAKIYYTVRELSNHATEIWALRSLGNEILGDGPGGGYPWLREHLIGGYTPQWYQHFPDGTVDASILSAPGDSRWLNYYIEGLAWLIRNVGIDGLYLDDVTYDRPILQRMRTIMARTKPGCLIDLHSNTGFSIGPANQYTGFFPYVDKLWFGESFQYDRMSPENWLVEVSGIPFGLMGDMLQGGGNRWLGMVFGMTVRYPWTTEGVLCDPRPVWKIWDSFGIAQARMSGFWERDCPVATDDVHVKATAYVKPGRTLVSLGNFSDSTRSVRLVVNWKALGLDPKNCRIYAPAIENFQDASTFDPSASIPVEPRKGWLLYLEALH